MVISLLKITEEICELEKLQCHMLSNLKPVAYMKEEWGRPYHKNYCFGSATLERKIELKYIAKNC